MVSPDKLAATRAFIRNFNILLKQAGIFGMQHQRSAAQFDLTWKELRSALEQQGAVHLGVAGDRLLLNGTQVTGGPAERSLVQMFFASGMAGMQFATTLAREDLARVVKVFASTKPAELLAQLKKELNGVAGFQWFETQFMGVGGSGTGTGAGGPSATGELVGVALAEKAPELEPWLNDPRKLLQLLAAAEAVGQHAGPAGEDDVRSAIEWLVRLGRQRDPLSAQIAVPVGARELLRQALESLAEEKGDSRTPLLVRLAEHMAIRCALEKYRDGDTRIDVVREMLHRMGQVTETLRKLLGCHEETLRRAGVPVEGHAEVLDRQFWASVPERAKREVLLSSDAWCIPPRQVRSFAEELLQRGDVAVAI